MRFGLIANTRRVGAGEAISECVRWIAEHNHSVVVSQDLSSFAPSGVAIAHPRELSAKVDVLISMGGDGTLLSAARLVGNSGTPILGVNLGALGFLTQRSRDELADALQSIVRGDYLVEERMALKADIQGNAALPEHFALNDVVINHGPISRVITIALRANNEDVVTFSADGLIVATPTGSTAYSLAAGGPVLRPTMRAIIATPISAFALSVRPMVFSPEDILEVRLLTVGREASLTLDGQVMVPITATDKLTVTKADFNVRFIVFKDNSFYSVLKRKLNWGVTPGERN